MPRVLVRQKADRKFLQLYYVDQLTGLDVTKSSRTTDWDDAQRAAARWEEELEQTVAFEDVSWEQFRYIFESEHMAGKSKGARKTMSAAMNHLEEAIGCARRAADINSADISRMQAAWRRGGMNPQTLASYLGNLRAAFNWGKRIGYLRRAPEFLLPKRPARHMRGRPLTEAEFKRFMATIDDLYPDVAQGWKQLAKGIWLGGMRLSEAIALDWTQPPIRVDLEGGRHPRLRFRAEGHKSRRDALCPITPEFAKFLRRWKKTDRQGPVFPLLSPKSGRPLRAESRVSEALSGVGKAADIIVNEETGKYASAHDLRRSFGTRWAMKVKPITLKALMRHKSIETTLKYYVDQDADDVADELWS